MTPKQPLATLFGGIAIFIWSTTAITTAKLANIPTLEILAITFTICFTFTAIKLTLQKRWAVIKQPILVWVISVLGIYGNDLTYIAALKHAPIAQADLINNLWPIFIILFSALLPGEKFTLRHLVAGLLGFIGVCILVIGNHGFHAFERQYVLGYSLAFLDALIWSSYSILMRYFRRTPLEMIGMACGIGALMSIINHLQFEVTVIPSAGQLALLIAMGLTTQGIAYYFWAIGFKHGQFKLLSVLSYFIPVGSIGFLMLFGVSKPTLSLFTALAFIVMGTVICSIDIVGLMRRYHKRLGRFLKARQEHVPSTV